MQTVIIGASHAGIAAAQKLRALQPNHEIMIIEATAYLDFSVQTLNLLLQKQFTTAKLTQQTTQQILLLEQQHIALQLNTKIITIDANQQSILIENCLTGEQQLIYYESLILAMTPTDPRQPDSIINQPDLELLTNHSPQATLNAYQSINHLHQFIILGAGLNGLTLADSFTKDHHNQVTLIERQTHPLARYLDRSFS